MYELSQHKINIRQALHCDLNDLDITGLCLPSGFLDKTKDYTIHSADVVDAATVKQMALSFRMVNLFGILKILSSCNEV